MRLDSGFFVFLPSKWQLTVVVSRTIMLTLLLYYYSAAVMTVVTQNEWSLASRKK